MRASDAFLSSISSPIMVVASLRLMTAVRALMAATASASSGLLRQQLNSSITLKSVDPWAEAAGEEVEEEEC
mgnify:FL=1